MCLKPNDIYRKMIDCLSNCFSAMRRRSLRKHKRARARLSLRGRDKGTPGERLSPTPLSPPPPVEWLSPPSTPRSLSSDPDTHVSDVEPPPPFQPGVPPPHPAVDGLTLLGWSKPNDYDMYLRKLSYGRELQELSKWPMRHLSSEIQRLHTDNYNICRMQISQPLPSPPPLHRQYLLKMKGDGKGKHGKVCIPIPDEEICLCDGDSFKCNCDHPCCPVHDDWMLSTVVDNKRLRMTYNLCRINYLMAYVKYSAENMPKWAEPPLGQEANKGRLYVSS